MIELLIGAGAVAALIAVIVLKCINRTIDKSEDNI